MPDKDKHFADNAGNIKEDQKCSGLNMVQCCLELCFSICCSALFVSDIFNIESYLVIAGPLSRNETYTGLAIRTEKVYKAETGGYVSYYAAPYARYA